MFADKAGADGLLIVTPYYNKPTQEGLYQHYKKINDNVGVPIIIYNIPSRSVIDMSVETMSRLFELKNIVGVKDATGDLKRAEQQKKVMGNKFIMLTGEDGNALEFNKKGGSGCISVTANVAAKLCSEMQNASLAKNNIDLQKRAEDINKLLTPLNNSLFIESNPSPVKYAASLLKLSPEDVRLPLVKITDPTKTAIQQALKHAYLI
jgi:4-hydroxy-tetrahydrodipicolinate synthase